MPRPVLADAPHEIVVRPFVDEHEVRACEGLVEVERIEIEDRRVEPGVRAAEALDRLRSAVGRAGS